MSFDQLGRGIQSNFFAVNKRYFTSNDNLTSTPFLLTVTDCSVWFHITSAFKDSEMAQMVQVSDYSE